VRTTAVIGLGKIGLPLAVRVAQSGRRVIGLDISTDVVSAVNAGVSPISGEPGLDDRLAEVVQSGGLSASIDPEEAVATSDTVIIVVPLIVDSESRPDFTGLERATDAVGEHLAPDTLVAYETTLPVGSTRNRLAPRLAARSGLTLGHDLFVAFSPERVSSGSVFRDLASYPKLVGGVDRASTERAYDFYTSVLEFAERPDLPRRNGVWRMTNADAAELAKLSETTYRDMNIAFANELAVAAGNIGLDVIEVIDACNSQPYSHIHRPGIAVGGHCIPVYPHLLMSSVPGLRLPALARQVNEEMPSRAIALLREDLGGLRGQQVVVLGLAYRGGVKESAFSGVFPLVEGLEREGAIAVVHDPLYSDGEIEALGLRPYRPGAQVSGAILQCDHAEYRDLSSSDLPGVRCVVDGRWILDHRRFDCPVRFFGRRPEMGG
jgi:nucleotide sugar dehydrogenase